MNFTIKRFIIENFQSHQKTVIELAPAGQLTVVNGPSRSGKSSIIRAIRWLFYNSPRGVSVPDPKERMDPTEPSYCRSGATFIRVTAEYEDDHKVIRERTRSNNMYIISTPGEEKPLILAGFGDNVPLEVQQATGIRPLQIGDVELFSNLSEQLDGPFLGSKAVSAPARAKVLGKLAGTEEIDSANKQLSTDLYRRNQDKKRLVGEDGKGGEIAELDQKIAEFGYLPAMARKIEHLETLVERIKAAQALKNKWTGLKASLENIDEKIAATQIALSRWRNLDTAESYLLAAQEKNRLNVALGILIVQMEGIAGNIYYARLIITKWSGLPEAERLLPIITSTQARKETLGQRSKRYQIDASNVKACQEIIERLVGLADAEATLKVAQAAVEKARQLRNIRTNYLAGSEMIKRSQDILSSLEGLDAADHILSASDAKKQLREKLESLSAKWTVGNAAVIGTQKLIEKFTGLEEARLNVSSAAEALERRKNLNALRVQYEHKRQIIVGAREQAVVWENRVAELEGAYHDLLEDVGICPLCGQEIESKIKEAV